MFILRFFINFEKEEKWLNKMAKEGWELNRKLFGYEFHHAAANDSIVTYSHHLRYA